LFFGSAEDTGAYNNSGRDTVIDKYRTK
jgi:hypothetical protein